VTQTLCTSCQDQPTTAVLCDPCRRSLEDALAGLASWQEGPPAVHYGTADQPPTFTNSAPSGGGRRVSSVWDLPSSTTSRGGTRALARELDTLRARQARLGDMNGPRLAPDSKVWWPFEGGTGGKPLRRSRIDRIEGDLTRAVRVWIARLHSVDVDAPRSVATGHVLARGCTWLLWHVNDLATHPLAAEAVSQFESVADRLEELVDRPADRVYAGPCWERLPDGGQCQTDLYAVPGAKEVRCRSCGIVHNVEYRKAWLADHMEDIELTATNCSRAMATVGLSVPVSQITVWATRGSLLSRGRVNAGRRSLALYRVGDVMLLAYKAAEDPRRRVATA
jgi:LSD1 subclass zinc finger protein